MADSFVKNILKELNVPENVICDFQGKLIVSKFVNIIIYLLSWFKLRRTVEALFPISQYFSKYDFISTFIKLKLHFI